MMAPSGQAADFMRQALIDARDALDAGEFPVGCVIVSRERILVRAARKGTAGPVANETDHAEILALQRLQALTDAGDRRQMTLFCTMEPCLMCFGAILLSGIGRIVYAYEDVMGGGTRCDLATVGPLYSQRSAEIVPGVLRNESLALFKTFFQNPKHAYWRKSLLAQYTLRQPL